MFAKEVADADLDREAGDLILLIGTDIAELHSTPVETTENLVLRKTIFGTGWTLYEYNDKYMQFLAQISLILLELISKRNVATAMRVRNGSFLVFFVERRKLKEASENGTKRAFDILLRCHDLMALSQLELYVKAEHPLEESHGMSDKDKVSIDKTSQAYKTSSGEEI